MSDAETTRPDHDTHNEREFDIVVWGATGFTGRLVAGYLLGRYGMDGFRWALGGRNEAKLEEVRRELERETGVDAASLPLVLGDSDDAASMQRLAERTRVVCTTVGPYALYGSNLLAACARAGTDYCDLTGEVHWMRRMIDAHHDDAVASGARIVPTCGFDSIPSDLGTLFLQQQMIAKAGAPSPHVKYRVVGFSGGASGGTIASMIGMMEEAKRDPSVMRAMREPYSLNPKGHRTGPDGADQTTPVFDRDFDQWTAPFVMAAVNTKVVRRSNALLGYAYGEGFGYDEAVLTGSGPAGFVKATGVTAGMLAGMGAMQIGPLRNLAAKRLPSPGEGPSKQQRESGYWDIELWGQAPDAAGEALRVRVRGDRDPGYGSTAKMLGESAVCLALDDLPAGGGLGTPASVMGEPLVARLQQNAGVSFTVES